MLVLRRVRSAGGTVPLGCRTVPPDRWTVPPKGGAVRLEGGTIPPDCRTAPPGRGTVPPELGAVPLFGGTVPPLGGTVRLRGGTPPPPRRTVRPSGGTVPQRGDCLPFRGGPTSFFSFQPEFKSKLGVLRAWGGEIIIHNFFFLKNFPEGVPPLGGRK